MLVITLHLFLVKTKIRFFSLVSINIFVRWIFTESAGPRVCHSCLPCIYLTGDLVFPCWTNFLSGTPRGWYCVGTGGKFLPSFSSRLGWILQGVLAPGLVIPASPSCMQLGTLVLPIRDQTSSLGPSGVVYVVGVGGKFLLPFCYLGVFFTGSVGLRVCHSCLPLRYITRVCNLSLFGQIYSLGPSGVVFR